MTFKIDNAPGKELIQKIIEQTFFSDFYEFYKVRVDWYGYPLIHDRFVTYGLYDDLSNSIPKESELISKFINYSIEIAERETDKRFLNAIFLVMDFCSLGKEFFIPSQIQINRIIKLQSRVKMLSFLPNMTTFWNNILNILSNEKTFDKSLYIVNDSDYQKCINLNFKIIDNNSPITCPVDISIIKKEVEEIKGEYEPLKFVMSAAIEDDLYWVWLYKNITGNIWSWYITVKQDNEGKTSIETHSMHGGVTKSPESLLLNYHYKP